MPKSATVAKLPPAASAVADGSAKHRIPVIARMMDVLSLLEQRDAAVPIRELVAALGVPRTTVYRILNTLAASDMVRRSEAGSYSLGPRLVTLAARVAAATPSVNLPAQARPHLERLSHACGEGSKLSVPDGEHVRVVAAAQGSRQYALSAAVGQRLPLHAGAAGKVILAFAPEETRRRVLGQRLERFTPRTIVGSRALTAELASIRARGWAEDMGEQMASVRAVAAPVRDRGGEVIAAVSVPFLDRPASLKRLAQMVVETAQAISAEICQQR